MAATGEGSAPSPRDREQPAQPEDERPGRPGGRGAAGRGSSTIAKGLALLRTVGEFPHGGTAAEIGARAGHPFSTTYRLLGALVDAEFVEYSPGTRKYSLGLPVFELGQRVGHARGFIGTAQPVLEALTAATHESSVLAVLDGTHSLTVHTVDGPDFRTTTDPGDRGTLHTSAVGQALLAWLPEEEQARLVEAIELVPRTPHSITDRETLLAALRASRERGWTEQSEENDIGMNALGAPVLRRDGTVIAALAIAAPVFRADLDALRQHVPELLRAAGRLGGLLP